MHMWIAPLVVFMKEKLEMQMGPNLVNIEFKGSY